jgi:uncharacterized delta-60 repeat protein
MERARTPVLAHGAVRAVLGPALLAVTLLCAFAGPATGAPGDLDTSFGGDGRVVSTFPEESRGNAVVVQPDESIVVAGSFGLNAPAFAISRWLPDGRPDPAFSADGQLTLQVGGGASTADAIALQPDGKIVVGGVAGSDLALLRLLPDGTPDPAFGTGGQVITPFPGGDSAAFAEHAAHGIVRDRALCGGRHAAVADDDALCRRPAG